MKVKSRNQIRLHRKKRISVKIRGIADKPRLCIFKSLKNIYAQVIDDSQGKTLVQIGSKKEKIKPDMDGAKKLGKKVAEKCLEKKIERIVFDRSGYKYHGVVKSFCDGAREAGLKF